MFEIMNGTTGTVLAVRATGKLSAADYRELLAPQLESLLARSGALNVLFVMDETFEGWSVAAALANTVLDIKYRRHFARVAMIGAPRWEQWCVGTAASWLISGELRTFSVDQLADAWEWLRADSR